MRTRQFPLTNCEFNGFTVYLKSNGTLSGGSIDQPVSPQELASRITDAQDNIQDSTIYMIVDRDVTFGQVMSLLSLVHQAATPDHLALVPSQAQIQFRRSPSGPIEGIFADRCRFEWPATSNQPKWKER